MPKLHDLTGHRFARLVVISQAPKGSGGHSRWNCLCDCGEALIRLGGNLRGGSAKSCGCQKRPSNNNNRQHGQSYTTTYASWSRMLMRCQNPNVRQYQWYGARGIKVCDRWKTFKNFYTDMGDRPRGMTLDRIDNDGNYEPSNCRWATNSVQHHNKRSNHLITFNGETLNLTDWANCIGISKVTLCARLTRYGWSIERALTTPAQFKSQTFRSKP